MLIFNGKVPVTRAADDAKEGSGYVYITEDDPLILRGVDTKFTQELTPKKQIMLSKTLNFASAEVLEVISDTEARLKKEFGKEGGKGTSKILERLKEIPAPGLSYKIVPYVDQQEMYMHVYEKLKSGGCVGIFPEGVSNISFRSILAETSLAQAVVTTEPTSCLSRLVYRLWH